MDENDFDIERFMVMGGMLVLHHVVGVGLAGGAMPYVKIAWMGAAA